MYTVKDFSQSFRLCLDKFAMLVRKNNRLKAGGYLTFETYQKCIRYVQFNHSKRYSSFLLQ